MRIVAGAALGLAMLGSGPATAQSLNDLGTMLKDRVLNQGQPNSQGQADQDRERRAYEQGRRDQARQEDGRRRGADQQQGRYGREREQRDYGDGGSYGGRRSDTGPRYDAPRPRDDRDSDSGRY